MRQGLRVRHVYLYKMIPQPYETVALDIESNSSVLDLCRCHDALPSGGGGVCRGFRVCQQGAGG